MPKKSGNETIALSKAEEEEMSSALIAQLLAEDACGGTDDYYAEYSNHHVYHAPELDDGAYEDKESEDEYDPRKKKSKSKKSDGATPGKRGRKRKTTEDKSVTMAGSVATNGTGNDSDMMAIDIPETQNNITSDGTVAPTGTKRARKPVLEGMNVGVYTEDEERRFLEGLDTFGREWAKLTAHVGTRDANSIRSHAQKHFIKLYRDNLPLPGKVRESGEGYTLSGKPLDPNSSAAKPYLVRSGQNETTDESMHKKDAMAVDLAVGQPNETVSSIATVNTPLETNAANTSNHEQRQDTSNPPAVNKLRGLGPQSYDSTGRTNYSQSRLRQPRDRMSISYNQIGKDDDPLTMVKCEPFAGKPGTNLNGCQPFEITVQSNVLLAIDFHAHLMTTEIIGFLAGEWDRETKRMWIKEAFPCRSLNTGQNDVNVEMDPTSAIETRQAIEEKNMTVVGWYHSHPTFTPDPSLVDIENQRNYQTLCREQEVEPFVGVIVGPYDPRLPGSASVFNWFHVGCDDRAVVPKRLVYTLQENTEIEEEYINRLFTLLDVYKDSPEKVDFAEFWRQDAQESKLSKMIKSLGANMPWLHKDQEVITDAFLDRVQHSLKGW